MELVGGSGHTLTGNSFLTNTTDGVLIDSTSTGNAVGVDAPDGSVGAQGNTFTGNGSFPIEIQGTSKNALEGNTYNITPNSPPPPAGASNIHYDTASSTLNLLVPSIISPGFAAIVGNQLSISGTLGSAGTVAPNAGDTYLYDVYKVAPGTTSTFLGSFQGVGTLISGLININPSQVGLGDMIEVTATDVSPTAQPQTSQFSAPVAVTTNVVTNNLDYNPATEAEIPGSLRYVPGPLHRHTRLLPVAGQIDDRTEGPPSDSIPHARDRLSRADRDRRGRPEHRSRRSATNTVDYAFDITDAANISAWKITGLTLQGFTKAAMKLEGANTSYDIESDTINATGTTDGIEVVGAESGVTIGGLTSATGNTIFGATAAGVRVIGTGAGSHVTIQNDVIGIPAGSSDAGNKDGIDVGLNLDKSLESSTNPGILITGNQINNNTNLGIDFEGPNGGAAQGGTITKNTIASNGVGGVEDRGPLEAHRRAPAIPSPTTRGRASRSSTARASPSRGASSRATPRRASSSAGRSPGPSRPPRPSEMPTPGGGN